MSETIVIGGGPAGLAAAALLARSGAAVTVLERAPALGGRARTLDRAGYRLNLGPHALYLGGPAADVLRELGVAWSGRVPGNTGLAAYMDGALHALPARLSDLLATRLLGPAAKLELARVMVQALYTTDLRAAEGLSIGDWIDAHARRPEVRRLLEAFVRVATYGGERDGLCAAAALQNVRLGNRPGVAYLDGGWQTLCDGLRAAATAAGVRIETGARAAEVVVERARVSGVRLVSGGVRPAGTVLLAVPPREAARLAPAASELGRFAAAARPVRVATLDLGLARLPEPGISFALGVDRPLYFSVHSRYAALAPEGGAVIHAAKYLGVGPADPAVDRAEIEALLDLAQPGWRDEVVAEQHLPAMTVSYALVTARDGGLGGRPAPAVREVGGLFVCGDWVGPEGMLLDAALASARAAARDASAVSSGAAAA